MRVTLRDEGHGRISFVETTIDNIPEAVRLAGLNLITLETLEDYLDRYEHGVELMALAGKEIAPRFSIIDDAWWLHTGEDRAPDEVVEAYDQALDYHAEPDLDWIIGDHEHLVDKRATGPHTPDPKGKEEQ